MNENEKRPAMPEQKRSENSLMEQSKDKPKLSDRQRKVYDLLRSGKHSAADITIKLGYCDPRSYVAILRRKNINVADEWVELKDTRFKKYWIKEI